MHMEERDFASGHVFHKSERGITRNVIVSPSSIKPDNFPYKILLELEEERKRERKEWWGKRRVASFSTSRKGEYAQWDRLKPDNFPLISNREKK